MRFYFANFSQFKMRVKSGQKRKKKLFEGYVIFFCFESGMKDEKRPKRTFFAPKFNDDEVFINLCILPFGQIIGLCFINKITKGIFQLR